jgi:predicted ArsR family transcriptional regulator
MGERQKQLLKLLRQLLKLLRGSKPGLSVDGLSRGLEITRTQYANTLQPCGRRRAGGGRPHAPIRWRGRPQQLYVLTELGEEMSPRPYSWLAQLVVASVRGEEGVENMSLPMR